MGFVCISMAIMILMAMPTRTKEGKHGTTGKSVQGDHIPSMAMCHRCHEHLDNHSKEME